MTTSNAKAQIIEGITWTELQRADYHFNRPFGVLVEKDQVFEVTQVLRILPKKRVTAVGVWHGRPAIIKIFFDKRNALRHRDADVAGMKVCYVSNIPAPALYFEGTALDKRLQIVIYEFLQQGESLYSIWEKTADINTLEPLLKNVVIELATQHVLGVLQEDCHLKNFFITDKQIITLDGGQITASDKMVDKPESMENLALFLSQLGVGLEVLNDKLFIHYAKARGWLLKKNDITDFQLMIKKYDKTRWLDYDKKLQRSSSAHLKFKTLTQQGMVERAYLNVEMKAFLKDPDSVFSKPDNFLLKNGRSSTVIQAQLDGQAFVIKRYNLKHLWHRVRRSVRVTRALMCWRYAHQLRMFHVATPKPIAYVERAVLGLRGRSYLVTEAVKGVNIGEYCANKTATDETVQAIVPKVIQLLAGFKALKLTHGDLKKTNIIVNKQDNPMIIDLDGIKEHQTKTGLNQSWKAEKKRFLRNFDNQPTVKALFESAFDSV